MKKAFAMQFEILTNQSILAIKIPASYTMSNARRTFLSAVWNHAGRIFEYTLMYVTSILIARGLGVEENGRFVGLFSLSQLLLVMCSFGLETALNKFIPQLDQGNSDLEERFILRRVLLLRVSAFAILSALFAAFLRTVSVPFLEENQDPLATVILFTGIRSLVPLFAMVLTARLQTATTSIINLSIRTVELGAVLWLMTARFTVENLLLVFLGSSTLHVLAYLAVARKTVFGQAQPVPMRPILTFAGLFWANTLVDFVLGRQGPVLLLANLSSDRTQASLFDVAYSVAQLASMAMTVGLSGVMFATFARLAVEDRQKMDRFYEFSIRIVSLLSIPLFCFIIANAEGVLQVLYSSSYVAAAPVITGILALRVVARLFGGPENAEYLLSRGKVGTVVSLGVAAAAVNLALNILLIPRLGALGSVVAVGVGGMLANMLGALAVFSMSSNRLQFLFWLKVTLVSVVASVVSRFIVGGDDLPALIIGGLVFLGILVPALVIVKPLTAGDAEWFSLVSTRFERMLGLLTASPSNVVQTRPTAP